MSEPIQNRWIEFKAHTVAVELAHRCDIVAADLDMAEVIIRQALRDALAESRNVKPGKKNLNRDVSE